MLDTHRESLIVSDVVVATSWEYGIEPVLMIPVRERAGVRSTQPSQAETTLNLDAFAVDIKLGIAEEAIGALEVSLRPTPLFQTTTLLAKGSRYAKR